MTEAKRIERRETCKRYLRMAGSVPAAMALAHKDGFSQNTSVWIGALSEMLGEGGLAQ